MTIIQTDCATELSLQIAEPLEDMLAQCEEVIGRGLADFFEVGNALLRIRDGRLYRNTHRNFGEYCRDRWNFGRAHANRLVVAAQVSSELSPLGDISHEKQIRPLLPLGPEKRREAWAEALKATSRPTEKQVRAAVQKITADQIRLLPARQKSVIVIPTETIAVPSDDRYRAFLQLATEEVRDLLNLAGWPDLREVLMRLRDDLESCQRIIEAGQRPAI